MSPYVARFRCCIVLAASDVGPTASEQRPATLYTRAQYRTQDKGVYEAYRLIQVHSIGTTPPPPPYVCRVAHPPFVGPAINVSTAP